MLVMSIQDKSVYTQDDVIGVISGVMGYMLSEVRRDVYGKGLYLGTVSKFESLRLSKLELDSVVATKIVNYVRDMVDMLYILGYEEETSMINILMEEVYDMLSDHTCSDKKIMVDELVPVLGIFELV